MGLCHLSTQMYSVFILQLSQPLYSVRECEASLENVASLLPLKGQAAMLF